MSTRVLMHADTTDRLRIELRQSPNEVFGFGLFVTVVVSALYALMPEARQSPGWLVAILVAAAAWSAVAMSAHELYVIDCIAGTVEATRSSLLGRRGRSFTTREVAAVRLRIGGPDDNRHLVELMSDAGVVLAGIPWRLTTLTESAQSQIGDAIAQCLGVRLRDETRWRV